MNKPLALPAFAADFRARFTADEFEDMVGLGAFAGMKVELLDGELERMTPPKSVHGRVQMNVAFALREVVGRDAGLEAFGEIGIRLGERSVVAADAALIRPHDAENRVFQPDEVVLAVEVANSTLARDLGSKRFAYAEAGIANYWVIDVARRLVHRFVEPTDGDYLALGTLRFGEPVPVPGTDRTIVID